MFDSFSYRTYRWYWTGSTLTHITFRIQEVVLGWQILQVTDSAFWVGAVAFAYGIPLLLLSPVTGFLADKVERQRLVMVSLVIAAGASILLALLTLTQGAQTPHILLTSFVLGSAFTLYAPARLALLPNLVPDGALLNASTLEYSTTRLAGFIGPVAAGLLMDASGVPATLVVETGLFILAAMVFMHTIVGGKEVEPAMVVDGDGVVQGLRDVLVYLRANPPLLALMTLGLILVPFGMTYSKLMQVFVNDVLESGATTLGILLGLGNLGAALSGFAIAAIGDTFRKGQAVLLSSVVFGLGLIIFSFLKQAWLAAVVIFAVGLASGLFLTLSNVLLQSRPADRIRGRVLSVWGMIWGLIPITSLAAGAVAEQWGITVVIATSGALCVLACGVTLVRKSPLLQL